MPGNPEETGKQVTKSGTHHTDEVAAWLPRPGARKLADSLAYPPRLMELERAASYVGFGRTKFQELVVMGVMPKSLDVEGSPRWDRFDLDRAVDDLKEIKFKPVSEIDGIIEKLKRGAT